jgi:hypothetical protein
MSQRPSKPDAARVPSDGLRAARIERIAELLIAFGKDTPLATATMLVNALAASEAPVGLDAFTPDYTLASLDAEAVASLRVAALDMPGNWSSQRHRRRLLEAAEDVPARLGQEGGTE